MSTEDVRIEFANFAVVDRPLCVWAPDLEATNLRYLHTYDPTFFLYQAEAHDLSRCGAETTDQASAHHAALALRIAFGVALEALFSMLGAVIQAPHCVFGWLTLYKPDDPREIARRLLSGAPIMALEPLRPATLEHIADVCLAPVFEEAPESAPGLREDFLRAWRALAHDCADQGALEEFNSIKHAFRVAPGSFQLEIGTDGAEPGLTRTVDLAHSYIRLKRMDEPSRRHHYDVGYTHLALEPKVMVAGLRVIACSLHNLLAAARGAKDEHPSKDTLLYPDKAVFDALHVRTASVQRVSYGGRVSVREDEYLSKEEILAIYEEPSEDEDG